ncbi:MAG: nuclear transport factor 2 family protein [Rhodospirillaceae bacterium]|nr:nuclear transport factor 2 family protein [Rhodospirillaceae bacterium]
MPNTSAAAAYVRFYETLSPDTVSELKSVAHEDVRFKDPFNDVFGLNAYTEVLGAMFRAAPDIKFEVLHCSYDGEVCFLRWNSRGTVKALGKDAWTVDGMSELRFAHDGRVISHIDFWDASAQFYERIPVIGSIIRFIQRRVAAH